jgi:hypothetical protein
MVLRTKSSLPAHLQTTANELHNLIHLLLTAHEAAAYHVGFEAGKLDAELHVDRRGRLRVSSQLAPTNALRLHDGSSEGPTAMVEERR